MKTKIGLILSMGVVILLFQNCGKAPSSLTGSTSVSQSATSTESVLGVTSGLNQISYNANINSVAVSSKSAAQAAKVVDVSLDNGSYTLTDLSTQQKVKCQMDVTQEQALKSLLSISRICQPVIDSAIMYCMALPAGEDVVLSNAERKVGLAKPICHNGTYLCDGNDEKLRAELELLRQTDPASCQAL